MRFDCSIVLRDLTDRLVLEELAIIWSESLLLEKSRTKGRISSSNTALAVPISKCVLSESINNAFSLRDDFFSICSTVFVPVRGDVLSVC